MLLCKVLQGSASEVGAIMSGKWGVKHTGAELDAMSEVAKSAKNRYEGFSQMGAIGVTQPLASRFRCSLRVVGGAYPLETVSLQNS